MNINTSINNYNSFSEQDTRSLYQQANEEHNVDLVRTLNHEGLQETDLPPVRAPSIISNYMDIATKSDIILRFFQDLRKSGQFLSREEFMSLKDKTWRYKDKKLCRIIGCEHLKKVIQENKLKHIKVPRKVAVFDEGNKSIEVKGYSFGSRDHYQFYSDQVEVHAEHIESVNRKISREEIDELIQAIACSNFGDLWPQNFMIAQDGIYFIDTELKSFDGPIEWRNMGRFNQHIKKEDMDYFKEVIDKKIVGGRKESYIQQEYDFPSYDTIEKEIEDFDLILKKGHVPDDYEHEMLEESHELRKLLEYVGAKKVGTTFFKPNLFQYEKTDLLIN